MSLWLWASHVQGRHPALNTQPACAPIEMHDMATVDDRVGHVVNGQVLDDDYNRCILPPIMDDNLDDLHRSTMSPKLRTRKLANILNAVKPDIQGGHVVFSELVLMQITKVILSRLKIWWMVHICIRQHWVKNSMLFNLYDVVYSG